MEWLVYIFYALPFAFALGLAAAIVCFVFFAVRSFGFGLGAIIAVCLFAAVFPGFAGVQVGIRLDALDFVTLLIALATLLRLVFVPAARQGYLSWYVFLLVVLGSLVHGLATQGTAGGVAARPYFYMVACTSYVMVFRDAPRMVAQVLNGLTWAASALVALVVLRWVITYLPIPALLPPEGRFASIDASLLRVIPSHEAALMAQVALAGIFYPALAPAARWLRTVTPVLVLMVVVLQHRSVWLTMLSGIACRFALPQAGRRASVQLAAMALVLAVLAVPLIGSGRFGGVAADVGRSADRAVALADTVNFRFDSWRFTVSKWAGSGPVGILVGLPMGTPMDRTIRHDSGAYSQVSVSAHNFYVQTLFNTGLVGLFAVLAAYAMVLRDLVRGLHTEATRPACSLMLLLVMSQLVYYVAYGASYMQGLIFGLAAALAVSVPARTAVRPFVLGQRLPMPRPHV